ncbi:MAG TPA: D-2-hydroxyacid dehydrogenase [Caulobacteraceae bacterium]|nr:D-2-hydroxyacid dehydrogenase [Caulobacteraceae bacterium]
MTLRVAVFAAVAREPIIAALRADGDVEVIDAVDAAQFIAALDGAQVAVIPGMGKFYTPEVAAAVAASKTLTWVQLISAGYDGVSAAGWPPGVQFTHPGGALSGAVAEHAFALLLTVARQIDKAARAQTQKTWERPYLARAVTMSGATLAIVGFGSIGQRIARLARGFDMTVIGISRSGRPVDGERVHPASELLQVLPQADAVICALPISDETRGLFDAQAFACCKPTAIFVNVGRGAVVDQPALIAALTSGALAGAGLDVTDPEPLPPDDPLWDAPNLLITPHYAAAGDREAAQRIAEALMDNLRRFRAGEPLVNLIVPPNPA